MRWPFYYTISSNIQLPECVSVCVSMANPNGSINETKTAVCVTQCYIDISFYDYFSPYLPLGVCVWVFCTIDFDLESIWLYTFIFRTHIEEAETGAILNAKRTRRR